MARRSDKRSFWTLDAETDPFRNGRVPVPFLWGLYTGSSYHTFATVAEVVDAIKDTPVIVYAHNGGKFDFHLEDRTARIMDHLNLREEMKVIDGRLVSARIGQAEIRDSWNLLPAPLKDFGGKLDIEMWKLEADVRDQHMAEIRTYLKQDCVGLHEAIATFEARYGRHLTQAGAAMAQWVEISALKPPQTDAVFFEMFSQFYAGGRVEAIRKGYLKGPYQVRDIRSAYPRAMLDQHPYDPTFYEVAQPTVADLEGSDMVVLEAVSRGALPFRVKGGGISFPRDDERRLYTVTGWEVIAAYETGALSEVSIRRAYRFPGRRDFGAYINHFYAQRAAFRSAGMDAEAFFAKILMNSLYGKFGANPDNYGNFMCVPWDEKLDFAKDGYQFDGHRSYEFNGRFGMHALVRADLDPWQKRFINVATAASITGWVRAYLWRELDQAQDPIYCDTDCIIAAGFRDGMPLGEQLGEWNLEGTASDAWVAGKKLYYLKGQFEKGKREKMAAKGVRPDPKAIKAAAMGEEVTVESEAPTFTLRTRRKDGAGVYFQKRTIRST